ncbi:MAG: HD domain-containing phosphohydrolase [Acholeplasmataceae bacterium]
MPYDSILEIALNLMQNLFLLFSTIFIYTTLRYSENRNIWIKIITGAALGMFTYLLMRNPWQLEMGLFFDARSVMMAISGAFFGLIPTLIAAIVPIAYRISVGGSGVYSGVLTIIVSGSIGLSWKHIRKLIPNLGVYTEYLTLGFIAHVGTMLCFLTIPWPLAFTVIKSTLIPYLVLFPLVTMFISVVIHHQKERLDQQGIISIQQTLLQASIDSTSTMEIFAIDKNYKYLSMNQFHRDQMLRFYDEHVNVGENYLEYIHNDKMRNRIEELVKTALTGKVMKTIVEVEVTKDKYLEEHYTPIKDKNDQIIGVAIFSEDVTERHTHEQSILHLSYRDSLTNLYNRRYYQEELARLDNEKYYPLTIVFADINGLKIMNDAFGHDAGDELIITVSEELLHVFHRDQRISRIGGDEFAILLPNTPKEKAQSLLDTVKIRLQKRLINGMNVTVSYGIATKIENEDINLILKEAEDDMYAHKLFEVTSQRNETIRTILQTLYEKNPREKEHSDRVSNICLSIGEKLGMQSNELNMLKAISVLHDIGKIAIDDQILNKPGKLNDNEWESIKRHPEIGYRILSSSPEYISIAEDILYHHERYDGKGYPRGLKGEEIPIRARIITIADSFDAMVSDRPYRKALSNEKALSEIKRCAGTQFDPKIAELFIELFKEERIT